jgi:GTP pyrophosphokinase
MDEQVENTIRELIAQAQERFTPARAKQIGFAAMYSAKSHEGQMRKDGSEFILHPLRVAKRLIELNDSRVDDVTIITALLHDVVEDTNKTVSTIQMQFGRDVASIVDVLTRRPQETREVQDKEYFTQITNAAKTDSRVILIKLSDQIDNAQDMSVYSQERRKQRLEHIKEVFIPLAKKYKLEKFAEELQRCYDIHQA